MYCGSDVNVKKATEELRGSVNLDNIRELANDALEGSNYEEAYRHATTILEHDPRDADALIMKGEATGMQSTLASHRLNELIQSVNKAVEVAPEDDTIRLRAITTIMTVGEAWHNLARGQLMEYSDNDTWGQYIEWLIETKNLYGIALELSNTEEVEAALLHRQIALCRYLLEGYSGSMWTDSGEMPIALEISDQFKPEVKSEHDEYVQKLKQLEPDYAPPTIVEKGACFIATVVTGGASSPMTLELRKFRNEVLDRHVIGRQIILKYYEHSPKMITTIRGSRALSVLIKWVVVFPSYVLSRAIMKLWGF